MNKKILLSIPLMVVSFLSLSQTLQTSLKVVGNKARIVVKAVGGNIVGQPSNFVFSVAIPAANSAASMTITTLDATRLPTGLNSSGNYSDVTYEYFNLTYTGAGGAAPTFTDGVEYELIELNFTGSTSAPVSLTSLPDGNPGAASVPGNWYNYLEVGGIQYSDPPNLFFQSSNTLPPIQATDYSTGIARITTNVNVSLPVNMLNFSGYKSGAKNVLRWTTANEQNNAGFEVQRSANGISYSTIGFVNSLAGGGNSGSDLSYSFDDNSPAASRKSYYRLNQKDIDGRSKLSNIVVISGDKPTLLGISGIFPNPASTLVNVIIDAPKRDDVTLVVMDVTGKTISQKIVNVETGSNTVPVEIGKLASGSYMVKVVCKSSDCETAVSKFVKQ